MENHVTPNRAQIRALFEEAPDTPVVMLNLNRYKALAEYEPGDPNADTPITGKEAYMSYGVVAFAAVQSVGGQVLWAGAAQEVIIGCDHDQYDEVIAVWYPSRAAFASLPSYPGYDESHVHREAALEQSTIIAVTGDSEPGLSVWFM